MIPLWVRANGCGDAVSYPVWGGGGPGGTDTRTYDWRVPFDARIVAVGGHLHGGAKDMLLSQPECGGRRLLDTAPRYGMPDNLYYTARPILHEPGPVDTRYFLSQTGIQVRRGETLTLTGTLRLLQAAHAGDVDHARLPGQARRAGDAGLRARCPPTRSSWSRTSRCGWTRRTSRCR